jgi:hypothetical protein
MLFGDDNDMNGCECPLAGFCERHQIHKGEKWHSLCQSSESYRAAWDRRAAGNGERRREDLANRAKAKHRLARAGREAWRRLFLEVETLEDLRNWECTIPRYGCNCKRFYDGWLKSNPVEIDGEHVSFRWKWSLKSAVNQHLGHDDLTLDEAINYWTSSEAIHGYGDGSAV